MLSPRERIERLRALARRKGLRLTPQRDLLLRILGMVPQHLTADELYRRARAQMPSLSHATVYRNAQLLVRAGVIGALERPSGPVRYDVNLDHHHHFLCERCGRILDVRLGRVNWRAAGLAGAQIRSYRLQIHGVCPRCRAAC
jgi:Fur family peroxide stress response transcriptional regulator